MILFNTFHLCLAKAGFSSQRKCLFFLFCSSEEVHCLLKALVLFHFDKQAQKLQLAFGEALQTMEAAVPEVWPEGVQTSHAPVSRALSHRATARLPLKGSRSQSDACTPTPQVTGPNSTANSITASFQQQKPSAGPTGDKL